MLGYLVLVILVVVVLAVVFNSGAGAEAGYEDGVARTASAEVATAPGDEVLNAIVMGTVGAALVSWKLAPGSVVCATTKDADVSGAASGVEVVEEASASSDDDGVGDSTGATVDPDEAKLPDAVTEPPLLTSTLLTITTSPSMLVTLTSTVVVPKPIEFSKKL
jgi:hypothetical protein